MLNTDEDALTCDLMETYRILDMRELSPSKVAVFSCGLRETSRIQMVMSDSKINVYQMLLSGCFDYLALLAWFKTEDGQKNINRPKSILNTLLNPEKENSVVGFRTADDFESYRKDIVARVKKCQQ